MQAILGKLLGIIATIAAWFDRRGEYMELALLLDGTDGGGIDIATSPDTDCWTLPTDYGFLMRGFGFNPSAADVTYTLSSRTKDHTIQFASIGASWVARSGRGAYNVGGGSKANDDFMYFFPAGDQITVKAWTLTDDNKVWVVLWGEKIAVANPRYRSLLHRHTAAGK